MQKNRAEMITERLDIFLGQYKQLAEMILETELGDLPAISPIPATTAMLYEIEEKIEHDKKGSIIQA